jgi:hypothetical protein
VRIFPNRASCVRLVRALAVEQVGGVGYREALPENMEELEERFSEQDDRGRRWL